METLNDIYQRIQNNYTKRQHDNMHLHEARYQEVTSKIPEIKGLDDTIADLSYETALNMLEGDEAALDLLKANIEEIKQEKLDLLTGAGYPADYLDPIYHCEACKDSGYINNQKCSCFSKAIVKELYQQSRISDILQSENFDTFSLDYYPDDEIDTLTEQTARDNMKSVLEVTHRFVDNFDTSSDNLVFYGETGVGKTFLTHCIAKELLETSHTVVYLTSLELFDILGKYQFDYATSAEEKSDGMSYILNSDLLIIDDLGTELTNNFVISAIYNCIDSRINRAKSTIISTNLSLEDLRDRYTERVFSRFMSNYTFLKIFGEDIRIIKAIK